MQKLIIASDIHGSAHWCRQLIDAFENEINVLINASIDEIGGMDSSIAPAIEAFRNKSINVVPGGGGQYGHVSFDENIKKRKVAKITTLDNF